jgi:hypothetical protein
MHGLSKHKTRPVWFSLVVDDFGIHYAGRENAEHLTTSIKKKYDISSDWTGSAYCGLKIDWNYTNGTVDLSMPGYIKAVLHMYQHTAPARAEHTPHKWNTSIYGGNTKYIEDVEGSHSMLPKDVKRVQQLGGTLLYYVRAADPTLIMTVNVLAT